MGLLIDAAWYLLQGIVGLRLSEAGASVGFLIDAARYLLQGIVGPRRRGPLAPRPPPF